MAAGSRAGPGRVATERRAWAWQKLPGRAGRRAGRQAGRQGRQAGRQQFSWEAGFPRWPSQTEASLRGHRGFTTQEMGSTRKGGGGGKG